MDISPDFQDTYKYDYDKPGEANLDDLYRIRSRNASGCPSFTIEMPFKDNADLPDELPMAGPITALPCWAHLYLNPILFVLKDLK